MQFGLSTPAVTAEVTPLGPTDVSPGEAFAYRISVTNNEADPINAVVLLYARLKDGRELSLGGPVNGWLGPGDTVSRERAARVPWGFPPGSTFRIFAQAETAVSFDEDWIEYTVVQEP